MIPQLFLALISESRAVHFEWLLGFHFGHEHLVTRLIELLLSLMLLVEQLVIPIARLSVLLLLPPVVVRHDSFLGRGDIGREARL